MPILRRSIFTGLATLYLLPAVLQAETGVAQAARPHYDGNNTFEMAPPPPGPYQIDTMPMTVPEEEYSQVPHYQQPQVFQELPPQAYAPAKPMRPQYNMHPGQGYGYGYMPPQQQAYPQPGYRY